MRILSFHYEDIIWSLGVTPNPKNSKNYCDCDKKSGRILGINKHLEAQGYPGVFAIVDCEFIINSNTGTYPSGPPTPTAQHSIIEVKGVTNNSLVEGKTENKKH